MNVVNIGICGFGDVGKAFVDLLHKKKRELEKDNLVVNLKYIFGSRGYIKTDGIEFDYDLERNESFVTGRKVEDVLGGENIDMMVITTPTNKETGEPAYSIIKYLLNNGVNVITADKGPIVLAYRELIEIAQKNNAQLWFGCTVGGALPSINGGKIDLAGAEIKEIAGVLNGTTNYILKTMQEEKIEYHEALKMAQKAGIAETNPMLDVEGWDSAIKLLILTNALMNLDKKLTDIEVEGITRLTYADIKRVEDEGKKYKLICESKMVDGKVVMKVEPKVVDSHNTFYNISGKNKCISYKSDTMGDLTIIGGASGLEAAAASILRDLINFSKGYVFK